MVNNYESNHISQYVSEILEMNGEVGVIYIDFSKAFDRVDYGIGI